MLPVITSLRVPFSAHPYRLSDPVKTPETPEKAQTKTGVSRTDKTSLVRRADRTR
jgi:hypothetical protein